MIQCACLQGVSRGGVQVSKKRAGFIANIGHATAADYIKLVEYVRCKVQEKFGIRLENEARIKGDN